MDKDRFNYLVRNYNSLTQQETAELRAEQNHFSYSQLLRNMIARGDQDNQTEMKDLSLTLAAVYSTDRAVLKQIMSEPRALRVQDFVQQPVHTVIAPQAPWVEVTEQQPDIDKLEQKSEPAQQVEPIQVAPTLPQKAEEKTASEIEPTPVIRADSNFDPEVALSRFIADLGPMREMKLKFEKALEEFDLIKNEKIAQNEHEPIAQKPKRKPRAVKNTTEQLLEEIKTTKKKVAPETPKQIEQIEIIDQFIKTKPIIPKAVSSQTELDLSGPNDTYTENVVSETLALILIKQGKKEKAVEVLRKLIWKFPQKKAYFAAQIEELTK